MNSNSDDPQFISAKGGSLVLGALYMLVGIGLFVSLVTGWMALFAAVLVATLALVVLSLAIVIRQEGLVTPENKLIGGFVLLAMGLLFGLYRFAELPFEVVFGIVVAVGVLVPHLLLKYTDYGTAL